MRERKFTWAEEYTGLFPEAYQGFSWEEWICTEAGIEKKGLVKPKV